VIAEIIKQYEAGEPLYVAELRDAFTGSGVAVVYRLALVDGVSVKTGEIPLPAEELPSELARSILFSYVQAELYNLLTTLGGSTLTLYTSALTEPLDGLVDEVVKSLQIDRPRDKRGGAGRVMNVIERMLDALGNAVDRHPDGRARFRVEILKADPPAGGTTATFHAASTDVFTRVAEGMAGRVICGVDVGGTDIKAALVVDGQLLALKEHDWNPAAFSDVELLIDPIVDTVKLLNARAVLARRESAGESVATELALCTSALGKEASVERLHEIADSLDQFVASERVLDGIGLCFPDVVVRDKIVGGEVPKTIGMRSNTSREFEEQFAALAQLDELLRSLCKSGGVVKNTNDGPMAAFTAAVEIAAGPHAAEVADGVFAHTLGTDLGTGIVLADGTIPEIPLEVYNLILDVGSRDVRELPAADVRSLRNTNTDVVGTLQRFTSQTGAFRLAQRYFTDGASELLASAESRGFLRREGDGEDAMTIVPESPKDMRKAYLAHLMELATRDESAAEIFRDIGEFLALTWQETEHILATGLSRRFLFGRLVKVPRCFELMCEGAARRAPELTLAVADSTLANTPVMKQLAESEDFSVAQFGQAIGAVYFANMGIQDARG
jgi:hypothetical protein